MKISVKSIVKSLINDNMKSLGFKCKDNIYYRHINGVLQGFKIYSRDMCYTIRFASYPLCSGITRDPGILENHEITVVLPERREVFFHIVPWGETITEEMQIEAWNNRETKYVEIAMPEPKKVLNGMALAGFVVTAVYILKGIVGVVAAPSTGGTSLLVLTF